MSIRTRRIGQWPGNETRKCRTSCFVMRIVRESPGRLKWSRRFLRRGAPGAERHAGGVRRRLHQASASREIAPQACAQLARGTLCAGDHCGTKWLIDGAVSVSCEGHA